MSQTYFNPNSDFIRRVKCLEMKMKEMERASAGMPFAFVTGPAGALSLTGSDQDIPGMSVPITRPGVYWVWWCSRLAVTVAGGTGDWAAVHVNGTGFTTLDTGVFAMLAGAALSGGGTTVSQSTQAVWTAAGTLKLQARHNGGTLTASVLGSHSTLVAIRTGPA